VSAGHLAKGQEAKTCRVVPERAFLMGWRGWRDGRSLPGCDRGRRRLRYFWRSCGRVWRIVHGTLIYRFESFMLRNRRRKFKTRLLLALLVQTIINIKFQNLKQCTQHLRSWLNFSSSSMYISCSTSQHRYNAFLDHRPVTRPTKQSELARRPPKSYFASSQNLT